MAKHFMRYTVSSAHLDADPTVREYVMNKLDNGLIKAVGLEAAFGETIVSFSPVRESQVKDLCSVQFEKSVTLTPLVRCWDCKHYNAGFECLVEGYGIERPADYFCADGERKGGQDDA